MAGPGPTEADDPLHDIRLRAGHQACGPMQRLRSDLVRVDCDAVLEVLAVAAVVISIAADTVQRLRSARPSHNPSQLQRRRHPIRRPRLQSHPAWLLYLLRRYQPKEPQSNCNIAVIHLNK